jgi:hypothetical protein
MNIRTLLRAVGLMVLLSGVAIGQENLPAPTQAGAYDLFGNFKIGYRVVSVNPGDADGEWFQTNAENLFREQYNMTDSGFALGRQLPLTLNLFGTRREGQAGFFDQVFLNADFNPTTAGGSLRLRQFNAYEFNLGYKHVDYFFDRYDSLNNDLRRYESNRNDLNASFTLNATDFLDVNLAYRGIGHGGTLQMPRPMFIEGATGLSTWQNVSRLYYLTELPRTDYSSDFSGSLRANFSVVDVEVGGGMTDFTEDYEVTPILGSDSLAMNFRDTNNVAGMLANKFGIVGDQSARERLRDYRHTETRELSGPYVFGSAVIKPIDILSLTADVRVDMLEGTGEVTTHQLAEARKTSAARAFQLYRGHYAGEITNTLDKLSTSVAATVAPIPELSVTAGLKMTQHELTSTAEYRLSFDSTSTLTEIANFRSILKDSITTMDWLQTTKQPMQTIFGNVTVTPMRELTLNAGVKMITRSPERMRSEDGVMDSVVTTNMSKETKSLNFDFGASYRPMRELRLRGRFEMMTNEATFSDDLFVNGPAAGTVTDLEPRTTPEDKIRVSVSADYEVADGLSAGVRFGMSNGKSDLNESMFVNDGPTEKVELKDNVTNISGRINYRLGENTTFRLSGETRSSEFSIPMTWTRGQEVVTPVFARDLSLPSQGGSNEYDSATIVVSQKTDDLFIDFGVQTRLIDALSIGAGVSYLAVTGEPVVTPEVKVATGTPVKTLGDVTRTGGPFNRITINGNVGYDITSQFGLGVDVMYAMQNEEELKDPVSAQAARWFYGLNDYNGLSAAFSVVYNF